MGSQNKRNIMLMPSQCDDSNTLFQTKYTFSLTQLPFLSLNKKHNVYKNEGRSKWYI
jgi:hypothetical protein